MRRVRVYVDGENHYLRSFYVMEKVKGFTHEMLDGAVDHDRELRGIPNAPAQQPFVEDSSVKLFWHFSQIQRHLLNGMSMAEYHWEVLYFTAITEDRVYEVSCQLRNLGFEPTVLIEEKDKRKQRDNMRDSEAMIDKPKGCDIALSTRMILDAAMDQFEFCILFTSDEDFTPVVEAVRQLGKPVWVFGYESGLKKKTKFKHVPDRFVDLTKQLTESITKRVGWKSKVMEQQGNS